MRKILIPIDFSEVSEEALRHAIRCPCAETKQILLLHVVDPVDILDLGVLGMEGYEDRMREALIAEAERKLEALKERYASEDITIETRVVVDKPWRGIVQTAVDEGVDAIVMGAHGRGHIAESLLGSAASRVVAHAPVPVMVVKPPRLREQLVRRWRRLGAG